VEGKREASQRAYEAGRDDGMKSGTVARQKGNVIRQSPVEARAVNYVRSVAMANDRAQEECELAIVSYSSSREAGKGIL
jgi:flagellar biosynthesis/type III secretory pathway protein FliH